MNSTNSHKENQSSSTSSSGLYIEWIHCNTCYEQFMHKRRNFYLLACYHVTCQQCAVNIKNTAVNGPLIFKCHICHQQAVACIMNNDMPLELKLLFDPEFYNHGFDTYRILLFQEKHRRLFLDHLHRESKAIEKSKISTQKIKEETQKLYQDLQMAKAERRVLEKKAIKMKRLIECEERKSRSNTKINSSSPAIGMSSIAQTTGAIPKISLQGPRMPRPTSSFTYGSGVRTFKDVPNNNFTL